MVLLLSSCKKSEDAENRVILSNTSWISDKVSDAEVAQRAAEYLMLKFTSSSAVEAWLKHSYETTFVKSTAGTYILNGNQISITLQTGNMQGTIDGNTLTFSDSSGSIKFTKQ
jgi:hypothetical protein